MSKRKPSRRNMPSTQQQSHVVAQHRTELISGPLPDPEILKGFEEVHPGAAERIISMAENESKHRHQIEKIALKGSLNSERLGLLGAFLVCVLAFGGGFYCILKGFQIAGTILSGGTLATIVTVFIQGRHKK